MAEESAESPNHPASSLDPAAVADFHDTLKSSKRIIALLGAGVSVASGLSAFRTASGLWKNQDVTRVASPAGFRHDPGLVWQFYSYRRREALKAKPNAAHHALAELARKAPGFVALSQNVDNLNPRAGHPPNQLKLLHGDLFDLRCSGEGGCGCGCGYAESGNFRDPLTPALDCAGDEAEAIGSIDPGDKPRASPLLLAGIAKKNARILRDEFRDQGPSPRDVAALKAPGAPATPAVSDVRLSSGLSEEDLPRCPRCENGLLRPGVVWFGEALPVDVVDEVQALFDDPEPVDLFLTVGTSSRVWPAAGYADMARKKGARVAVVNTDADDAKSVRPGRDWVFVGDAAVVLPQLLRPVIGEEKEWQGRDEAR